MPPLPPVALPALLSCCCRSRRCWWCWCPCAIDTTQAEDRIRGVKAELRGVVRRLTEMNPGGFRWGSLQEDGEGNIEVDEIVCTK